MRDLKNIKFRGKTIDDNEWIYGDLVHDTLDGVYVYPLDAICLAISNKVNPDTVGQFTSLHDKDGKEIYEGDIIEFYETESYCINPDCEPHLIGYGDRLIKRTCQVEFAEGMFCVDAEDDCRIRPFSCCGLHEGDVEDLKNMEEFDAYFDNQGYEIDDSIIGIKVVGNIVDNPDLKNA